MSTFLDAGLVVQNYKVNTSNVPENILIGDKTLSKSDFFADSKDYFHFGIGCGIHFAFNENFIIAVDYGIPLSIKNDGETAFYFGLNWLY